MPNQQCSEGKYNLLPYITFVMTSLRKKPVSTEAVIQLVIHLATIDDHSLFIRNDALGTHEKFLESDGMTTYEMLTLFTSAFSIVVLSALTGRASAL